MRAASTRTPPNSDFRPARTVDGIENCQASSNFGPPGPGESKPCASAVARFASRRGVRVSTREDTRAGRCLLVRTTMAPSPQGNRQCPSHLRVSSAYNPVKPGADVVRTKLPVIKQRYFRAGDGTRLAWYEAGRRSRPDAGLPVGTRRGFSIWQPFIERFAARCRLIGWDYRGLYESSAPLTRRPDDRAPYRRPPRAARPRARRSADPGRLEHGGAARAGAPPTPRRYSARTDRRARHERSTARDRLRFPGRAHRAPRALATRRLGRGHAGLGPRVTNAPGVARGFTSCFGASG